MSGESLGTARLDLIVDVSQFEAAVTRAKNLTQGMSAETRTAFDGATGDVKRAQNQLLRYVETIGKTSDEIKLMRAAWAGVDDKVIEFATQKILEHNHAVVADKEMTDELRESWTRMQAMARAAANDLKQTARTEALEAQARAARAAADAEELLRIKEQHAQQGSDFQVAAAEAAILRRRIEQTQVFTEVLDQLEAAEARAGSQRSFLASLESQAVAIGKTRSELMQMKAAELGVETEAAPFIAKMREQEAAVLGASTKFNQYGKSAKEVQLALRGVPAQLTDIFVSLQSGQMPLTVLLQQGGQLRDMFGGFRPAIAAMGNALLGLVNPATVSMAAATVMVAAWYQGEEESRKLADALTIVGDHAGATSGQVQAMAASMANANRTQHESALALAEVIQSGRFASDQYQLIAAAATDMERATGQALSKTISQFAALRDDPVKAVAELNKETHFLTAEIFDQIRALQEQGRTQEAARVATEAYANSVIDRASEIDANLGLLQRGWRNVANAAKGAWDAMLDIGREETPEAKIKKLNEQIAELRNPSWDSFYSKNTPEQRAALIQQFTNQIMDIAEKAGKDRAHAQNKADADEAMAYYASQQSVVNAHKDADARTASEIDRLNTEYATQIAAANRDKNTKLASDLAKQRDTLVSELRAEQAKRNRGAAAGIEKATLKDSLQDYKDQLANERGAIQNETQLLQAQYSARLVSAGDYYAKLRDLAQRNLAAQESAITGEIAVLKQRNVTGKDAIDTERQIKALEAELARVRAENATQTAILKVQESDLAKQRELAHQSYSRALDQENHALSMQFQLRALAMGLGQQEAELLAQITQAYADQAIKLQELDEKKKSGQYDTAADYERDVAELRRATDEKVRIIKDGYKDMLAAQGDWLAGLQAGWQDWADQANDVSGQMRAMSNRDMDIVTDGFVTAAETGKLAWRNMLIDMLKELEKFLVKQAILKTAYAFVSAFSGNYSGSELNTSFGDGTTSGSDVFFKEAKGDVFDSPSLSAFSNGVYSSPQFFKFAKGAGVFAEAGPEAVMPLTRDSQGNLGVRAQMGTGANGTVNLSVTTIVHADGTASTDTKSSGDEAAYREFTDRMRAVTNEELQRAMRQGGSLWKAGVRA